MSSTLRNRVCTAPATSNNVRTSVCSSPALPVKKSMTRTPCLVGLTAEPWPTNLLPLCTYSSPMSSLNNSYQPLPATSLVRQNLPATCHRGAFVARLEGVGSVGSRRQTVAVRTPHSYLVATHSHDRTRTPIRCTHQPQLHRLADESYSLCGLVRD
jgi:hypothetical protein